MQIIGTATTTCGYWIFTSKNLIYPAHVPTITASQDVTGLIVFRRFSMAGRDKSWLHDDRRAYVGSFMAISGELTY